jgi:hypothetical protein
MAAARLVVAELGIAQRSLDWAIEHETWKTSLPLPTAAWNEYATLLVRWLDEDAVNLIVQLMADLAHYHAEMDEYMDGNDEAQLYASMHKSTSQLRDLVKDALDRLFNLASQDPLDQQQQPLSAAEEEALIEAMYRDEKRHRLTP